MNLLVTGAAGMLGHDVVAAARARGWDVRGVDLPDVDITRPHDVATAVAGTQAVINCAAYTRVDDAETEQELAQRVNGEGPRCLAQACRDAGAVLMHVSTDYVFDGAGNRPYREDDATAPLNVYGASKLRGEQAVVQAGGAHVIVRSQSLFGRHGANFVRTMTRLMGDGRDSVRVVADQVMAPTYTAHLADGLMRLLSCGARGIVHVSGGGSCSWHAFAEAIAAAVAPACRVEPIPASAYPTAARRPAYAVLDNSLCEVLTGWRMPPWQEGLRAYLAEEEACAAAETAGEQGNDV